MTSKDALQDYIMRYLAPFLIISCITLFSNDGIAQEGRPLSSGEEKALMDYHTFRNELLKGRKVWIYRYKSSAPRNEASLSQIWKQSVENHNYRINGMGNAPILQLDPHDHFDKKLWFIGWYNGTNSLWSNAPGRPGSACLWEKPEITRDGFHKLDPRIAMFPDFLHLELHNQPGPSKIFTVTEDKGNSIITLRYRSPKNTGFTFSLDFDVKNAKPLMMAREVDGKRVERAEWSWQGSAIEKWKGEKFEKAPSYWSDAPYPQSREISHESITKVDVPLIMQIPNEVDIEKIQGDHFAELIPLDEKIGGAYSNATEHNRNLNFYGDMLIQSKLSLGGRLRTKAGVISVGGLDLPNLETPLATNITIHNLKDLRTSWYSYMSPQPSSAKLEDEPIRFSADRLIRAKLGYYPDELVIVANSNAKNTITLRTTQATKFGQMYYVKIDKEQHRINEEWHENKQGAMVAWKLWQYDRDGNLVVMKRVTNPGATTRNLEMLIEDFRALN